MKIVSRAQSASANMQWSYLRLDIWRQQRRSITVVLLRRHNPRQPSHLTISISRIFLLLVAGLPPPKLRAQC